MSHAQRDGVMGLDSLGFHAIILFDCANQVTYWNLARFRRAFSLLVYLSDEVRRLVASRVGTARARASVRGPIGGYIGLEVFV